MAASRIVQRSGIIGTRTLSSISSVGGNNGGETEPPPWWRQSSSASVTSSTDTGAASASSSPSILTETLSSPSQPTTTIADDGGERQRYSHYMWGTSKKGTIPVQLLVEPRISTPSFTVSSTATSANADGSDASSPTTPPVVANVNSSSTTSTGGGGLFSSDEKVIDHPMRLSFDEGTTSSSSSLRAFLFGEDSNNDHDTIYLDKVYCGASGTALVLNDGRCFVLGSNKNGELGIGQSMKETTTPIHLPIPDPVVKVSLGPNFSAIQSTTGDIYTFGYGGSRINGLGCLGHGGMESYYTPKLVESLIEDGCYAADVHCGEYSMTVLTTEGEVLTCGAGSYGRLGNLETVDQLYLEPVELLGAGQGDVTQIACGHAFSLALNVDGIVHAWGRNNEGQLGTGMGLSADMYAMESLPRPIEGFLEGRSVVRVAAGHTHAAAVTADGALFTWGMNFTHEPKLETTLLHTRIVDVACGQNFTLALDEGGRVYSMGKGSKTGVLGLASIRASAYGILVEGIPEDEKVVSMSCGWTHVAVSTVLK